MLNFSKKILFFQRIKFCGWNQRSFWGNILEYLNTLEVESSGLQLPGPIIPLVFKPLSGTGVGVGINVWDIPTGAGIRFPKTLSYQLGSGIGSFFKLPYQHDP